MLVIVSGGEMYLCCSGICHITYQVIHQENRIVEVFQGWIFSYNVRRQYSITYLYYLAKKEV